MLLLQYCEFCPNFERCKKWMEENLSDEMKELILGSQGITSSNCYSNLMLFKRKLEDNPLMLIIAKLYR